MRKKTKKNLLLILRHQQNSGKKRYELTIFYIFFYNFIIYHKIIIQREKIKETFNIKQTNDEEVRAVTSKATKLNKIMFKEESPPRDVKDFKDKTSNKIIATEKVSAEADTEKTVENNNSIEDKARTKLKEIKNLEIFKLREKTLKLTQKIETERGRRR